MFDIRVSYCPLSKFCPPPWRNFLRPGVRDVGAVRVVNVSGIYLETIAVGRTSSLLAAAAHYERTCRRDDSRPAIVLSALGDTAWLLRSAAGRSFNGGRRLVCKGSTWCEWTQCVEKRWHLPSIRKQGRLGTLRDATSRRRHGINDHRSVVLAKLRYASSAWWGFTTTDDRSCRPSWSPGRSIRGWRASGSSTRRGLRQHTVQCSWTSSNTCCINLSLPKVITTIISGPNHTISLLCHGPP